MHHALGSIAQWKDFPMALVQQTGLPALIVERLGHGTSDEPLTPRGLEFFHEEALERLPAVLQQLGIINPLLIGHSDGATIALLYAAHFPTAGVIAEAPHVMVENQNLEGICEALKEKKDLVTRLQKYHGNRAEELVECWAGTWLAPWFREWNIEKELSDITCPILVLQGTADPYGTVMQARSIQLAAGEKVSYFEVPKAGHFLHVEARDLVLERMTSFIRQIVHTK
ncbi:MAG: alpha/beta hydrolase [Saprospirales bacterium]|nr:alpha/beta hydrolase [Saprospirales bacterium]